MPRFTDAQLARTGCLAPGCGKPIGVFRDELSHTEALISGFCQRCQDEIWGNRTCPTCKGSGNDPSGKVEYVEGHEGEEEYAYPAKCPGGCFDNGKVNDPSLYKACEGCGGEGNVGGFRCPICKGRGEVPLPDPGVAAEVG